MHHSFKIVTLAAFIALASSTSAQTSAPKSLSTSLGVVVFPAKGQTAATQSKNEEECFNWSKTQTGYDPMNPSASAPPAQTAQASSAPQEQGGQRARGALRGAAAGAVIGEIADDDAGKGAEVGAAVGVMKGGAEKRQQKAKMEQQAAQQQQQTTQNQQAATQEQASLFNKGFSACLESKGYTVK